MGWLLAHGAEILQGFYDSYPEQLLPIAIDRRARSERLARRKEPFRQCQAIAGCVRGELWKYARDVGVQWRADLGEKVTALELQGCPLVVSRFLGHDRELNAGDLC